MIKHYHAVRQAARTIAEALDWSVEALREGRVEQEPAMTDRMLGAIETRLADFETKGIVWKAKTLGDRGRGSQESRVGADFMGVLNISLPDFDVSKGFLAQAKMFGYVPRSERMKLISQCDLMLSHTAASFVFLYGVDGIRAVPAVSVIGADGHTEDLYQHSAQRFFEDHLQCFIGDRTIRAATPEGLQNVIDELAIRRAVLISGRSVFVDWSDSL